MSAGIKNWHWKTKGVEGWAKTWFRSELVGINADGVEIVEVTDVEGDCEIGMRKSKLVTIYDQKISMKWKAQDSEKAEITGTLVCLEVSHDMDEDDYVFTSTLDTSTSKEAERFHSIAKKALANKLRKRFQLFPKALIDVHGKDLLVEAGDSPSTSGASTPLLPKPIVPISSSSSSSTTALDALTISTSSVRVEAEFQVSAPDLFDFLTNAEKIPMWSRNPATMKPEVGATVSLFGGNITGVVKTVEKPNLLVMSWRAPSWNEGHMGELSMNLSQGPSSTTLALRLTGVPVGKEEESERNLTGYYLNGLRSMFVASASSPTTSDGTSTEVETQVVMPAPGLLGLIATTAIPMTISISLIVGLVAMFYYGPSGPGHQ